MDGVPSIGHNLPPFSTLVDELKERLPTYLSEETVTLRKRAAVLLEADERFPREIADDDQLAKAGEYARLVAAHLALVDDRRKQEKAPFLNAGRDIDAHFKAVADPLESLKTKIINAQKAYGAAIAKMRAAAFAAEEKRLQDEADQALAAAKAGKATIDDAIAALEKWEQAQIGTPLAEQTRVRSVNGFVTSFSEDWQCQITDLRAVPFEFFDSSDVERIVLAAVTKAVRSARGKISIPGVKITETVKTHNRG